MQRQRNDRNRRAVEVSITPAGVGPIKAMIRSADLAALQAAMSGWLDQPGVDVRAALSRAAAAQGVELG
mgnify:CR=1 FL=1